MDKQTVLVTGASGFIAKHLVLGLLNRGHEVIGSVRSLARSDEVRDAVRPHLTTTEGLDRRLRFVALDLDRDDGWSEAVSGASVVMHTASPFPMVQPKNPEDVIRPAVDGARRALRAAKDAGIGRVVMTSSSAAVASGVRPKNGSAFTEEDWADPDAAGVTPYAMSKTLAERAAWDFARDEAPDMALSTINPAFVLGPALDGHFGTSVKVVERLLRARDPMVPNFGFPVVDVRDVAEAHIRAMERPETAGKRYIVADRFLWFPEMARILKEAFPDRRIVTRVAPDMVVRFLGIFDKAIRSIVPILGQREDLNGARARDALGLDFIDGRKALVETARSLIAAKVV
jgi:dihydroflavonol-4-reductase